MKLLKEYLFYEDCEEENHDNYDCLLRERAERTSGPDQRTHSVENNLRWRISTCLKIKL